MTVASHGLSDSTIEQTRAVLLRFPEVERAILFGSRAKGTHHRGSDIDLALAGSDLDSRRLAQIDNDLDDLLLPYRFSLVSLGADTDTSLAAHIQRVGQTLFERSRDAASARP